MALTKMHGNKHLHLEVGINSQRINIITDDLIENINVIDNGLNACEITYITCSDEF